MIGLKGMLKVIDNSGALLVECVQTIRAGSHAGIGDVIVCVVQAARPISNQSYGGGGGGGGAASIKVKRGEVRRALVVRTKKETKRPDGRYVRFDDNACVLINDKGEPLGTRILGVVAADLRGRQYANKILSLAPRVV